MIFSSDDFHFHSEMGVKSSSENENGDSAGGNLSGPIKGPGVFFQSHSDIKKSESWISQNDAFTK